MRQDPEALPFKIPVDPQVRVFLCVLHENLFIFAISGVTSVLRICIDHI